MFTGVTRYNVLAGRIEICAVQADSLPKFWALLLNKMRWPIPPKSTDSRILEAISQPDAQGILKTLAAETPSIITLARMLHDQDKAANKNMATSGVDTELFGDEAGNLDNVLPQEKINV